MLFNLYNSDREKRLLRPRTDVGSSMQTNDKCNQGGANKGGQVSMQEQNNNALFIPNCTTYKQIIGEHCRTEQQKTSLSDEEEDGQFWGNIVRKAEIGLCNKLPQR